MFAIHKNFIIVIERNARTHIWRLILLLIRIAVLFLCYYSFVHANNVFTRLLSATWNADGERVAKTNVLLYLALPSFPPFYSSGWFLFWSFILRISSRCRWIREPSVFTGGFVWFPKWRINYLTELHPSRTAVWFTLIRVYTVIL